MAYLEKIEYGYCRAMTGHRWDLEDEKQGPVKVVSRNGKKERMLVFTCARCTTTRNAYVNLASGEWTFSYVHPKDWALNVGKNEKRPARSEIRREVLRTLGESKRGSNGGARAA